MPKEICIDYGLVHTSTMEACQATIVERTRGTKKAGKASKSASREHLPESLLSEAMSALREREQQVLADIAHIELENRVFELEEKRARLLLERSRNIYHGNKSKYICSNDDTLTWWRHLVNKSLHNPIKILFLYISLSLCQPTTLNQTSQPWNQLTRPLLIRRDIG